MRHNKYEPLVEEADFTYATFQYAHIRFKNGRKSVVFLRNVAPVPGYGSSDQSWYEAISLKPQEVIHDGSSPSANALTHHEYDALSPELPDEEKKSLRQELTL